MSKESFQSKVNKLVRSTGAPVFFDFDEESGRHFAFLGDVRITGNTVSNKLTVRWGSGHQGIVEL